MLRLVVVVVVCCCICGRCVRVCSSLIGVVVHCNWLLLVAVCWCRRSCFWCRCCLLFGGGVFWCCLSFCGWLMMRASGCVLSAVRLAFMFVVGVACRCCVSGCCCCLTVLLFCVVAVAPRDWVCCCAVVVVVVCWCLCLCYCLLLIVVVIVLGVCWTY